MLKQGKDSNTDLGASETNSINVETALLLVVFEDLQTNSNKDEFIRNLLKKNKRFQKECFAAQTNVGLYEMTRYLQNTVAHLKKEILPFYFTSLGKNDSRGKTPNDLISSLTSLEDLLYELEEYTINKYAREFEEHEHRLKKAKDENKSVAKTNFIGRREYFQKLDLDKIENHPLKTSFKLAVNANAKDDFVFDMLKLPAYSIQACLEKQSTQDLYLLANHIESSIATKLNSVKRTDIPQIKTIANEYLEEERELLDMVKAEFKKRMKSSVELSTIKAHSDQHLKEKGWTVKRLKSFFAGTSEDKYINMYKHHLKYVRSHARSATETKTDQLKGKVLALANQYFNAHGYIDKDDMQRERLAGISGVNASEIASFKFAPTREPKGIQFHITLKDKKELRFGLTENELMKYAIIQHDFNGKHLTKISKSTDESKISLAEKFLIETDREKNFLVTKTNFQSQEIVDCTILDVDEQKYDVMVYTLSASQSFVILKSQLEDFAIMQLIENQKNFPVIQNQKEAKAKCLREIKEAKHIIEHLAEQYFTENSSLENIAQIVKVSITPDKSDNFSLNIVKQDGSNDSCTLTKQEIEDFAIKQFEIKKHFLQEIRNNDVAIESLASQYLMGTKKEWLAAASKIPATKILNCTIHQDISGIYILKVSLNTGSFKKFTLNKIVVEDFAVAQYRQPQNLHVS